MVFGMSVDGGLCPKELEKVSADSFDYLLSHYEFDLEFNLSISPTNGNMSEYDLLLE